MSLNLQHKIQILRKKLGISAQALSEQIKCARTAIAEFEQGKRSISLSELERIAKVLNVTSSYLLDDSLVEPPILASLRDREFTSEDLEELERLAGYLTVNQIAAYYGIHPDSFHRACKRHPVMKTAYKKGLVHKIAEVAHSLLESSNRGTVAGKIFFLKTRAGWKEGMGDDFLEIEEDSEEFEKRQQEFEEFMAWKCNQANDCKIIEFPKVAQRPHLAKAKRGHQANSG